MAIEFSKPDEIADERRTIREYTFSVDCFQHFTVHSEKAPMGNHYHRNKFEIFHFLEGGGTITSVEVDDNGEPIGEIQKIEVVPPLTIKIPAFHAHRFDMKEGTRFVCYSSRPFDPNDLHEHKLD